jgi:hypothetical protein
MERNSAETLAAEALAWIAADGDLLGVFLGSTGLSPDDLRARAAKPDFLASVLDFLLMDDGWVTAFCDATNRSYATPMQARASLPGGQTVNWT